MDAASIATVRLVAQHMEQIECAKTRMVASLLNLRTTFVNMCDANIEQLSTVDRVATDTAKALKALENAPTASLAQDVIDRLDHVEKQLSDMEVMIRGFHRVAVAVERCAEKKADVALIIFTQHSDNTHTYLYTMPARELEEAAFLKNRGIERAYVDLHFDWSHTDDLAAKEFFVKNPPASFVPADFQEWNAKGISPVKIVHLTAHM